MSHITWTDQHNIGVKRIDDQHRHLVELVNRLLGILDADPGRQELTHALDELLGFTLQHFITEERIMEANSYPGTADHKAEHKALLEQAREFRTRILNGELELSRPLVTTLHTWTLNHIVTLDRELGDFLGSDRVDPALHTQVR